MQVTCVSNIIDQTMIGHIIVMLNTLHFWMILLLNIEKAQKISDWKKISSSEY